MYRQREVSEASPRNWNSIKVKLKMLSNLRVCEKSKRGSSYDFLAWELPYAAGVALKKKRDEHSCGCVDLVCQSDTQRTVFLNCIPGHSEKSLGLRNLDLQSLHQDRNSVAEGIMLAGRGFLLGRLLPPFWLRGPPSVLLPLEHVACLSA